MPKLPVLAVVDDDPSVLHAMGSLMRSYGYVVHTFSCAEDFLHSLYFDVTECLVADIHMPNMSGMELLFHVREKDSRIAVILMSAGYDEEHIRLAERESACRVLRKPFDDACLLDSIADAMNRRTRPSAPVRTCEA